MRTEIRHPTAEVATDPGTVLRGRGWDLYLVTAVALMPVVVPTGPAQMAFVDLINLAALAAFLPLVLIRRIPLVLPFALPVLVISLGSLLAITNTPSVHASVITILQDVYLYLWLILLVALLSRPRDLATVGVAWVATAVTIALVGLVVSGVHTHFSAAALLLGRRERALGTFYNPNMYADYLVLSLFMALGLMGRARARILIPAVGLLAVALLSTKSNGGVISLAAGLVVWAVARACAVGVSAPRAVGVVGLVLAAALLAGWAHSEWKWGEGAMRGLGHGSFFGRMAHSSESRQRIWQQLRVAYARSPLGIGPGGSSSLTVPIGEREREGSLQSKESHNDYLGYAVERGPLGLAGLLLLTGQVFVRVLRGRARIAERAGRRWGSALWPAFLGALVATMVHSTVIEKLHFRHFWMLMAMAFTMTGRGVAAERVEAALGVGSIDRLRPHPPRRWRREEGSWITRSEASASAT
jgi:O-antigen ligase